MKFNYIYVLIAFCAVLSCSDDEAALGPEPEDPMQNDDPTIPDDPNFSGELDAVFTYGGSNEDEASAVVSTPDGGVIIVGSTRSIDGDIVDKTAPNFDAWVLKLSAEGAIQWSKTYGGSNDDIGADIINTTDGGYAFIGSNRSDDGDTTENGGSFDHWLVKLNASGDIMWQKSFGFQGRDEGYKLIQTSDGGYFFGGILDFTASGGQGSDGFAGTTSQNQNTSRSSLHAGGEFWGTKVDANGNLEFRRYFGGSKDDSCHGVAETPDGGYIMMGSSESIDFNISNPKGQYDFWVMKVGADKELEWERTFGGAQIDFGFGFTPTRDGNYLLSGDTRSSDQDVSTQRGVADFWAVKMSPTGDIIWENTFGGTNFDAARSIFEMNDGQIALAGSSRSDDLQVGVNRGQNDGWITVISRTGELDKEFNVGGSGLDFLYGIAQNQNSELFVVGSTTSSDFDIEENKGSSDLLLIRIK